MEKTALIITLLAALLPAKMALAQSNELNYLIVNKRSAPFQLVEQQRSNGGVITRIIEEAVVGTGKHLKYIISTPKRNKLMKKSLTTPWITYSAKVWQPDLSHARFIDIPLFDVRHSLLTCDAGLKRVDSGQGLHHRTLAILKNFDYPELQGLAERNLLTLVEVNSYDQGFMLAQHQRVDGFVEMSMRLQYHLDAHTDTAAQCFRLVDLSSLIPPFPIYLIVSDKLEDQHFDTLNSSLRKMKQSGRIAELLEEYLRPDI